MKTNSQKRIVRLYEEAAELSDEDREAFLASKCQGDPELKEVIEALLRSGRQGGSDRNKKRYGSDGELTASPDSDTKSFSVIYGESLPEHYRFIQRIGKGGMGEVILAEDTRLNRKVAIKFLTREVTDDPERLKRFRQEAQAASALNHPNIITVHDIGEGSGHHYIVCEYVQGITLSQRIGKERIPVLEAVEIAEEICSALEAAHASNIIHRDIKPDNVILKENGGLKVLDFGLAKSVGASKSAGVDGEANTFEKVLTIPGMVLGTPQYMSPEQARGRMVDPRSDLFSLGVILYEMLTGRVPFKGKSTVDVIVSIVNEEPSPIERELPNPPETLKSVIRKALAKKRKNRYESAGEMLSDLRELKSELRSRDEGLAETGILEPKTTAQNSIRSLFSRRFLWEVPIVAVVLALLGGSFWYFFGPVEENTSVRSPMRSVNITRWNSGSGELIAAASLSPDGDRIAFGSARSGSTEIWVKPTGSGEPLPVTRNSFYNQYPVWSPDGQEIAYFSSRAGERGIWKIPYTGGSQVQVIGDVDAATKVRFWAPSGKIYYQGARDLFSANVSDGATKQVTSFEAEGLDPRVIEISRDESQIAFSVLEDNRWRLKVKSTGSDVPGREIASSQEQIAYFAWMPDGSKIVYSAQVDGIYQVFEVLLSGGDPIQLSNGIQDLLVEDVSSDGNAILYGAVDESSDLWMVDTGSGEVSLVADEMASEYWADVSPQEPKVAYQSVHTASRPFGGSIESKPLRAANDALTVTPSGFCPVWSNDGTSIAFFRKSRESTEIWKSGSTGDEAKKLSEGDIQTPDYMGTPYLLIGTNHLSWSPDSNSIAYAARTEGVSNIWIVSKDGKSSERVTDNDKKSETLCCPVWTPDAGKLIYSSEDSSALASGGDTYAISVREIKAKQTRNLISSEGRIRLLGLDPSGTNAVFALKPLSPASTATPEKIYVQAVDISSGAVSRLAELEVAYFHNIHLSPDGRSVAFVSKRDQSSLISVLPLNGGTPRLLVEEKDPKVFVSSLSWSPDGNLIIFGRQSRANLLSMLVNEG
ncbi:MAG TPA: protein kinase [Aridibacter sp.]|nr:protein kinase [Aridibacter sp.]